MTKKASGLGRGLGDLLEDNVIQVRQGQGSAVRKEGRSVDAPTPTPTPTPSPVAPAPNLYTNLPKSSLYDSKPKNKSLKANFKNFNR